MPAAPNAVPVIEENAHLEAQLFGAVLTAAEVAKHLKVHPSMVRRMAQRGEGLLRWAAPGGSITYELRDG